MKTCPTIPRPNFSLSRALAYHVRCVFRTTRTPFLAAIVAFASLLSASAANWYVRPTAQGARNGVDWNNAWSISSIAWSSVNSGDTIWLAGGTYGAALRIGKAGFSGSPIMIKRATASDAAPVASPGWSSSFDSLVILTAITNPSYSHITVDGRTRYGIRVVISPAGGAGIFLQTSSGPTNLTNVNFHNIEVLGPYTNNASYDVDGFDAYYKNSTYSNSTISNCWFHGLGVGLKTQNWNNITVEYCIIEDLAPDGVQHVDVVYNFAGSRNVVYRYNIFRNCPNDGLFHEFGGAVNEYYYGNLFINIAIECIGFKSEGGVTYGPIYVYNNVFYSSTASGWGAVGLDGNALPGSPNLFL